MKILLILFLLIACTTNSRAQDTTLALSTRMFDPDQRLNLSELPGWVYRSGHNPVWASPSLNTKGWAKRVPGSLSIKDADPSGRVEGWFRLKISLDSTFTSLPLWVHKTSWVAAELYVDGRLLASFGKTGAGINAYQEHNPYATPSVAVELIPQQEHLIAIHVVEYASPFSSKTLKSAVEAKNGLSKLVWLVGPQLNRSTAEALSLAPIAATLWLSVSLIISLLLWLLSVQKLDEQAVVRLLAWQSSFTAIFCLDNALELMRPPFVLEVVGYRLASLSMVIAVAYLPLILMRLVAHPFARPLSTPLLLVTIGSYSLSLFTGSDLFASIALILSLLVLLYGLISSWKRLGGSQWAIVVGLTVALLCALMFIFTYIIAPFANLFFIYATLYFLAIPLSFLVYVVLRFREIVNETRDKAAAVVQITEEKRQLLATQNQLLEQQVETRTVELNQSLTELKASQAQLVQKEKLASLGELTAGIAHEIQNPLNFVNNFAEVSVELLSELKEGPLQQLPKSEKEYADEILGDLSQNLQKITHHGGRASAIVRGMLEHSRISTGEKEPTDLNALADEYLRLAYHGLRAKDKTFNATLVTEFDPTLDQVIVVPQELGRVLLNLYNNAFYAVEDKRKTASADYRPTVTVSTVRVNDTVEIRVKDNGMGIPESVKAKIFQPFFTTKPTGEGTGLGLSLSYDIVTKGHGGTFTVESEPNQETVFTISLPLT